MIIEEEGKVYLVSLQVTEEEEVILEKTEGEVETFLVITGEEKATSWEITKAEVEI